MRTGGPVGVGLLSMALVSAKVGGEAGGSELTSVFERVVSCGCIHTMSMASKASTVRLTKAAADLG